MSKRESKFAADLNCSVCHNFFNDPVILTCAHSFCKDCVELFWSTKSTQECPVCRTVSQGVPVTNLTLRNICESFQHDDKQQAGEARCHLHNKKLKVYCLTDKQLVCFVCRDSNQHADHKFHALAEAVLDHKEVLMKKLQPVRDKLEYFEEAKKISITTTKKIKSQAQLTEAQIRANFEIFHQFLRDEEAARIAALREEEEQKSLMVEKKIEQMNTDISCLAQIIKEIEEMMEADDISFMQNFESTMSRAQCPQQYPSKVSGPLIDVASHMSNLKFNIFEKMKSLVEYAPVTLDPNTANPHLVVSEDLTSVTYQQAQCLPDNDERFDHYASVLGSEGFLQGTHCWDVDVGETQHWELGAMAKSAVRKGIHKNENETKCWILRRSGDEYVAHSGMVPLLRQLFDKSNIPIPVDVTPKTIRVQLNCDSGKLSFFDPDNNMHLHTFTYTFYERMFPYFNTNSFMNILVEKATVTAWQQKCSRPLRLLGRCKSHVRRASTFSGGNLDDLTRNEDSDESDNFLD